MRIRYPGSGIETVRIRDTGSGMEKVGSGSGINITAPQHCKNQDPGTGINIPDPQH
jgi:hypothetical protein